MLHKVSSLKMVNQSQSHQTNWESARKQMGSPKSINMISSANINDKIGQVVKIIQQERVNRQKDIMTLSEKIKNSKCKHQVVYVQGKEIQEIKNIKDRNKSVDQNGMMSKRGSGPENVENQSNSQIKDIQMENLLKQNRKLKVSLERVSQECSLNSSKIEELQKVIQSVSLTKPKDFHFDKFSLLDQQISDIQVQCQQIPHLFLELSTLKSSQNSLGQNQFQSEFKIKIEQMGNKLNDIQDNMLDQFNNSENRTIQQISTLGAIVDRNLQSMHQDLLNDCRSDMEVMRKQFDQKIDSLQNCQLGAKLSILQQNITSKIRKIEQSISSTKNNCFLIEQNFCLLQQKNLKLEEYLGMNQNKICFIEKQCNSFQTNSSISTETNLDSNNSIIIFKDQSDHQKGLLEQKKNLQINECANMNGGLSQFLEVFGQNCSYLESRNIALEEHLGELVQVVNHVLSKLENYL